MSKKEEVSLDVLTKATCTLEGENKSHLIQASTTLGVQWSGTHQAFPSTVKDESLHLALSTRKKEARCLAFLDFRSNIHRGLSVLL